MKENGLKGIVGKCLRTAALLAMGMLLSGCVMGSFPSLTINSDFSGTRVMDLSYDPGVEQSLQSRFAQIRANAYATLPEGLSLTSPEDGSYYRVTLSFSSKEDYLAKVQRLIDYNRSCYPAAYSNDWTAPVPEITFIQGADGEFFYSENFCDMDLLEGWITKAHADAGVTQQDFSGSSLSSSSCILDYTLLQQFRLNGRDCALNIPDGVYFRIDTRRINTTTTTHLNGTSQPDDSPYKSWSWVQNAEGRWMFCSPEGEPARNKWIDGNYYVDGNGVMVTGWFQDPLTQYRHYFYEDSNEYHKQGELATNQDKDGGHIDQNGVWTKNDV